MRIVVIGAVAAGTSAAAKARRNDDEAQIVIYEKDQDISYSGCGLPYYIGGKIQSLESLTPRDPAFFKKKYDIDVKVGQEVLSVDTENRTLQVRDLSTGNVYGDTYDKLVLATGAAPFVPPVEGIGQGHVFFLRNVQNARDIRSHLLERKPSHGVIAGTGFIGLEMLENLLEMGLSVSVVEVADQVMPGLDRDVSAYLEKQLEKRGVRVRKSKSIARIEEREVVLDDGSRLPAELVLMATGVRPNTALAQAMGLELGTTGAIRVDKGMHTSREDVYACGDCVETYSAITGKPAYRPLGSTANKTGRIAGDVLTGGDMEYRGNLGTGIFKCLDLAIGSTGLTEREALGEGYDVEVVHNIKPDKPEYFHGEEMLIKAVADRKSKRLLGVQVIGTTGVDKRLDVFATLITYGATVDQLFHLDLAYAPPFSTTKDPVHYTGMILENAIGRGRPLVTADKLRSNPEGYQIIDARSAEDYGKKGCVDRAVNIPHAKLRTMLDSLDKDKPTVTYCNKGVTGNAAQNILLGRGFKEVYNLSGGHKFYVGCKEDDKQGE
ncbi:FAD-dependent oxidoreductase [Anaerotalea alkaliphila]|uniref:FAD-dependent oxidoreductase n=1 Tax=Anaerotalea alkaliphila TaxID=2662126 RepID=A0A7X5HVA6_9FIRM|nr:FAD-dependent oxidoreductase [Anaerotalea alkaliphila]NDL67151.1 FAD-dependent oxidoreductase [Anaerotalea alkaliphila]